MQNTQACAEGPPALSVRTEEKSDGTATAKTEKCGVLLLFMPSAFVYPHRDHIPSQPIWCQNSISCVPDIWLDEEVCVRVREAQSEHSFCWFLIFVSQDAVIPNKMVSITFLKSSPCNHSKQPMKCSDLSLTYSSWTGLFSGNRK